MDDLEFPSKHNNKPLIVKGVLRTNPAVRIEKYSLYAILLDDFL